MSFVHLSDLEPERSKIPGLARGQIEVVSMELHRERTDAAFEAGFEAGYAKRAEAEEVGVAGVVRVCDECGRIVDVQSERCRNPSHGSGHDVAVPDHKADT